MSKKSKIIITLSSIIGVLFLGCCITVNYLIEKEQNTLKCVDASTEQQVRYILNMPTGDISEALIEDHVWNVTKAFGEARTTRPNEEGLYTLSAGSNGVVDPPTEEYMDEEYLEFALWIYTYQTGEILAIEEIEKLVTEGNIEKKTEIDAYVDWHLGGGGSSISNYAYEYNTSGNIGNWDTITLAEKQAAVIEMEND